MCKGVVLFAVFVGIYLAIMLGVAIYLLVISNPWRFKGRK